MLEFVVIVDKGFVHKTNDDSALANHSIVHNGFFYGKSSIDEGIFAVADGVGSLRESELASRQVLKCLSELSPRKTDVFIQEISHANQIILDFSQKYLGGLEISTTLCLVSVFGNRLTSYNIGNSRLYRFRNGCLRQLTKDQTKVQELLDQGLISPAQMHNHPDSHVITKFLGDERFTPEWIICNEHIEKFEKGDLIMLSSDGVHDYISVDELEKMLESTRELYMKADYVIREVNNRGGQDNATIVLIEKK